jgi:hypothetical protein
LSLQSLQLASLKKGHMGQWTLGQGEQKFTWTTVALSKQFLELRYLVITGTCSAKENSPLFTTGIHKEATSHKAHRQQFGEIKLTYAHW